MKRLCCTILFLLILLLLASCSYTDTIMAVTEHKLVEFDQKDSLKIILIGDTGLDNEPMEQIMKSIQDEEKDYMVVLGDLVYPRGPKCPTGDLSEETEDLLDERIGNPFADLGIPVFLTVGNHDVTAGLLHRKRHTAREACYLEYAAQHESLIMPSLNFTIDLGSATIATINSNKYNLTEELATLVNKAYAKEDKWRFLFGHHGLKIYYNKEKEQAISNWRKKYDVNFDLIGNGHAHIQQFGIYDSTLAITTGASAKLRERPACDHTDPLLKANCKAGQLWGKSNYGYAVLEVFPDDMNILFKDIDGTTLYACHSVRGSGSCEPFNVEDNSEQDVE